jgi:RNA polymerase-binding protein DksA
MPTKTKSAAKSPPSRRRVKKRGDDRAAKAAAVKKKRSKAAPVARKPAPRKPPRAPTAALAGALAGAPAAVAPRPEPTRAQPAVRLSDKDLESFRHDLIAMRHRLTGKIVKMRQASLKREDEVNPEEDGTDAFDRLFSLERAGGAQEIVYKIDEALRAIEEGVYGVCQECGDLIQKPRLAALPFAKNCIRCQAEHERARGGHGGARGAPRRFVP